MNSESFAWLGGRNFKPDLFVILHPYWRRKEPKAPLEGVDYGVPFSEPVWGTVRCVIEVKKSNAASGLGQLQEYARELSSTRGERVRAMLIDMSLNFVALEYEVAEPVDGVFGSLREEGAREFLSGFLCWNTAGLPQMYLDLQKAMHEASLSGAQVEVLGTGGSGVVYKVTQGEDVCALKVVSGCNCAFGTAEVRNLRQLTDDGVANVPQVFACLESAELVVMQLRPVGGPAPGKGPSVRNVRLALTALLSLHRHGWAHGDARWPNFVFVRDSAMLIDFATAVRGASERDKQDDVYRLLASICELPGSNQLGMLAARLVRQALLPKLYDDVEVAIDVYCQCLAAATEEGSLERELKLCAECLCNVRNQWVKLKRKSYRG